MQTWNGSTPGQTKENRMRRIVVSLLKGGVAKSETAVHLAHGLSLAGCRVLLVDTDVQSHCGEMLGASPSKGLAQVIVGMCDPLDAISEVRDNLFLLAGGNDLAGVKMEIARRELAPEAVLADTLERYEGGFDYMIMDTAPGWDTLLVNALYCSQDILSPVSMEPMALSGLMRFEERLRVIQKYNTALRLRWIIPTFVDGRVRKTTDIMKQLMERYGKRLGPPIKYSVKLSEATAFGETIFEHDPNGEGAIAYRRLVEKIMRDAPPAQAPRPKIVPLKSRKGQLGEEPTTAEKGSESGKKQVEAKRVVSKIDPAKPRPRHAIKERLEKSGPEKTVAASRHITAEKAGKPCVPKEAPVSIPDRNKKEIRQPDKARAKKAVRFNLRERLKKAAAGIQGKPNVKNAN